MNIKNKLKVLRAEKNLTQQELAEQVDCTRQTINAIEKGKYNPSLSLAFRLAKVFEVPLEKVFQLEEERKSEVERIFGEIPDEHKRGYR